MYFCSYIFWAIIIFQYIDDREPFKGAYTLVMLPRIVTPYRDSVDETCAHVTYQKLVTR